MCHLVCRTNVCGHRRVGSRLCKEAKAKVAEDRKTKGGLCDCGEEDCNLELDIYVYSAEETAEFECEEPTISHCPVDEDCKECFKWEGKDMLMGELEKKAIELSSSATFMTPIPTIAFDNFVVEQRQAKAKAKVKAKAEERHGNGREFAGPVTAGVQTLSKCITWLNKWYSGTIIKIHGVRLEMAIREGDHGALKECKVLMEKHSKEFKKALDDELEVAKLDIINLCEDKYRQVEDYRKAVEDFSKNWRASHAVESECKPLYRFPEKQ